MGRTFIVGANFKANPKTMEEVETLINCFNAAEIKAPVQVTVAAPAIYLPMVAANLRKDWNPCAENIYTKPNGAFTGEITAPMIKSFGVNWTILGHSERRDIFGESDELLAQKAAFAIENDLHIIFCCGEHLSEREAGKAVEFVSKQIEKLIPAIPADKWDHVVIAYEPIWAIGTGKVASPADAQEMCKAIREVIAAKVNADVAANLRIQYGGSVSPSNCNELAAQPDVDGFLVGGASLKPDFIKVVESAAFSK